MFALFIQGKPGEPGKPGKDPRVSFGSVSPEPTYIFPENYSLVDVCWCDINLLVISTFVLQLLPGMKVNIFLFLSKQQNYNSEKLD